MAHTYEEARMKPITLIFSPKTVKGKRNLFLQEVQPVASGLFTTTIPNLPLKTTDLPFNTPNKRRGQAW